MRSPALASTSTAGPTSEAGRPIRSPPCSCPESYSRSSGSSRCRATRCASVGAHRDRRREIETAPAPCCPAATAAGAHSSRTVSSRRRRPGLCLIISNLRDRFLVNINRSNASPGSCCATGTAAPAGPRTGGRWPPGRRRTVGRRRVLLLLPVGAPEGLLPGLRGARPVDDGGNRVVGAAAHGAQHTLLQAPRGGASGGSAC